MTAAIMVAGTTLAESGHNKRAVGSMKADCTMSDCVSDFYLLQTLIEIGWYGSLKRQCLASDGMRERQFVGMQAVTASRLLLASILAVARDRMSDVAHVHTNLVFAACEQLQLDERMLLCALEYAPCSNGELASTRVFTVTNDPHILVVTQPALYPTLVTLHHTIDHSNIAAVGDHR